ncbi:hypothetical protein BCR44DRAFT_1430024 [Catenaria anguillulae PL171]|uniref:Transmembrane protein n=1 Tax=Catenaria anguillulae PL171 TaxID=765915 RepID=A0A1Y2HTB5_9FUNG|nr:hypothetical protein BCR44DRAFT_1430024 [Catenaria anguillulae PL171]
MIPDPLTPSSPTRRPPSTRRSSPAHAGSTAHIPPVSPHNNRSGSRSAESISRSRSHSLSESTSPHAIDDRIRHYLDDQARLVHQMQRTNTVDSTASHRDRSPGSSKTGFVEALSRMGSGVASPTGKGIQGVHNGKMEGVTYQGLGEGESLTSTHVGLPVTTVFASEAESPQSSRSGRAHERLSKTSLSDGERDQTPFQLDPTHSASANGHSVSPSNNMLSCPFTSGPSGQLDPATHLFSSASGVSVAMSFQTAIAPSDKASSPPPPGRPKNKRGSKEEAVKRINEVIDHISESLEQLNGSSPNLELAAKQTMMVITSPTVSSLPRVGNTNASPFGDAVAEQFQLGTIQRQQLQSEPLAPSATPPNSKHAASASTLDRRSRGGRLQTHPPNGALEHQHASMSWNVRLIVWLLCVAAVVGTSAYASWNAGSIANRNPVMSIPMDL